MGPGDLKLILSNLPYLHNPDVLVSWKEGENAGIYKLTDELAIVQTIDVITPLIDDPYLFGQVAAVNALSDIYAMGGKPITALNVVFFPSGNLDIAVLEEIMKGGLNKLHEAEAALLGGHTLYNRELKYGLSVTGIVNPKKIIMQAKAKAGDKLILTKPLGTGLICDGLKRGEVKSRVISSVIKSMTMLNKKVSELMQAMGAHACTDITGYGLLGHASEMALKSKVGIQLDAHSIPIFPGVESLAREGHILGGTRRNKEFYINRIEKTDNLPEYLLNILFDPQTSGGLLISISEDRSLQLLDSLHKAGFNKSSCVGEVLDKPKGKIVVRQ